MLPSAVHLQQSHHLAHVLVGQESAARVDRHSDAPTAHPNEARSGRHSPVVPFLGNRRSSGRPTAPDTPSEGSRLRCGSRPVTAPTTAGTSRNPLMPLVLRRSPGGLKRCRTERARGNSTADRPRGYYRRRREFRRRNSFSQRELRLARKRDAGVSEILGSKSGRTRRSTHGNTIVPAATANAAARIANESMTEQDRHNSFVELLTRHQSQLYGYIFALVRNREDAADLFQSVGLILWRKFDSFRPG